MINHLNKKVLAFILIVILIALILIIIKYKVSAQRKGGLKTSGESNIIWTSPEVIDLF